MKNHLPVTLIARHFVLAAAVLLAGCHNFKALPEGVSYAGPVRAVSEVAFLEDHTWIDANGERQVEQEIFDEVFALIQGARRLIVTDMFLYNDFQGPEAETTRALSQELTRHLVAARRAHPQIEVVVITDPVNTLYRGLRSAQFDELTAAGVRVVETNLNPLRDSNFWYSPVWRLLFKPFGNDQGGLLPNPIGPGRVSMRTYLKLVNFKANHRKTLIVDAGDRLLGLVSSANPHDGSSAHRNAAIRFDGLAAHDLLATENAVLRLSGAAEVSPEAIVTPVQPAQPAAVTVQIVTEKKIEDAILHTLDTSAAGDQVDLMMFYLSDRHVINALKAAHLRGARLRLLLDPNKDAFGREKNGVPNRPVAHKLVGEGIDLRWCDSHGEQCHAKMLLATRAGGAATLISGSANFTRRNLDDFNLETDVVVRGPAAAPVLRDAQRYFDQMWNNPPPRHYSTDYAAYRDGSLWHRFLYCVMEGTGMSSF